MVKLKTEIWGGMECTINRVSDQYFDQFEKTGQYEHLDDLRKVCQLGISKLRFPILWERHHNSPLAWKYTSKQLKLLDSYGVIPIVGLLHHGSGPRFTNLADPAFPELLAAYAHQVAIAYPALKYYTPVNEPLTTARFSGLYGYWYPHATDEMTFCKIFLHQLKGIVLSMQSIRKVNPDAELIQTEDLCKIHSTISLQYQADFENERRWWTYDFLTSKVTKEHMAWNYFTNLGIHENELQFFIDNPCVPAVAGFNYYVTSERYLDDNIHDYPPAMRAGNSHAVYIDTEAVRSGHAKGLKALMSEAWERYNIPMAITECHLSCTREQQLRWFNQQWKTAKELNEEDVPIMAITAWSLVGAYDWNSLVTKNNNIYDSGTFKIKGDDTLPTALSYMIRTICMGQEYNHPVLAGPGWWGTDQNKESDVRPIIVIGNKLITEHCKERYLEAINIGDAINLREMIIALNPWAVIAGKAPNDNASETCLELNVKFLIVTDGLGIHEVLDDLIDKPVD
ncbi:family 1 glycosylhydrolase [Taibaiella lutea]|uniref:Family 1 glycosylhydrolase n=1 Tax=Taibaiella lutea TaxID=2608001 RepID=A0A5M6CMB8_9BACT|nr:family 1 glycosylhydrolase [Taibaiella lutea]KAA5536156.1 family 1 glycosylhydrolase [Taibaiella lutea]